MKLPLYPKYKPSGVDWLGDVPDHWDVKALKRELSRSVSGGGLVKGNMASEPADDLFKGFSASGQDVWVDEAHYDVPGIVLSAVGARCGKAFKADGQWTAVANTHVFFPRQGHSRDYLWYLLNNEEFWEKGGTAQPYVRVPATLNRSFTFAPPDEQQTIADFLDRETARLDTLVGKKRELIETLKEKRTALISRTVTRGLPAEAAAKAGFNAHPKLKPSGIEWLGDVPEHWDVMRLKWRARCQSGEGIAPDDVSPDQSADRGIPVIGGNGVMGYCDASNCEDPVVVIGRVGALCGNVHCIKPPAWVTDNALLMPIDARVFRLEYLAAVLRSRNLNELADKTAQPLITGTRVRSEVIPIPPAQEQHAIANYLDRETAKIDKMIEKVEAAIEKLQEYRTALITAAVTGKIDARKQNG